MPGGEFDESKPPPIPGEPEGWRDLQKKARSAQTLKELDVILAEMNRLLAECEKKAAASEAPHSTVVRGDEKQTPNDK